jgi:hypothetical protein
MINPAAASFAAGEGDVVVLDSPISGEKSNNYTACCNEAKKLGHDTS